MADSRAAGRRVLRRLRRQPRSAGPPSIVIERTDAQSARVVVPRSDRPRISIVIVTYQTSDVVIDCLERIVATTDPLATPYEVIVVDNVDDEAGHRQPSPTVELLRSTTHGITILPSPLNTGFGGGNNIGAATARGEFLCLCNPDVLLPDGWAPPLLAALEDRTIGVAAPAFVSADGSVQELGQVLLDTGLALAIGGPDLFPDDWNQAFPRPVDYASAALWVLRREVFLEVNGFSPAFHPAYWEDVDLALRLEAHGLSVWLVPEVRVVHIKGGSSPSNMGVAQRSHATFQRIWADRLRQQPEHPRTAAEQEAARDRAARKWQRGSTPPTV
jgi:GT2 family glycosyltransferase